MPPTDRKPPMRLVTRVDRSPLNPSRWLLELECGHDEWVTAQKRPTRLKLGCYKCVEVADATD